MFLDKTKDSVYLKELAYAIHEVSQPEYLIDLMETHKPEMDELLKPLKNEIKNSRGFLLANLQYNQEILKGELERIKGIYEIQDIKTEDNTIQRLEPPDIKRWQNNNTILVKTKIKEKNKDVYNLSRDNTSASAYTVITNNKVSFGQEYSSSILAKKGDSSSFFGFRIQGDYPNRIDAMFDLEKGVVKGKSVGGDFENVNAIIKPQGNGWFLCTLAGKIKTNNIRIILGPTTVQKNSDEWEGLTNKDCDVNIIPSSLLVEKVYK